MFIASGNTTPGVQPQVTGVNIGSVHITASAPGYTSTTVPAQVTATLTFSPPSLSVVGTSTQNFTVTLSGSAPVGGINVTVIQSNTGVATVASQQFTFLPNGGLPSTLSIPVTGVTAGTAVIHVGAPPFIPDTTANVTVLQAGTIGVPSNLSVEPGHSVSFPITLGTPAPAGGVTVNLESSDTTKLTVSPTSVVIAAGDGTDYAAHGQRRGLWHGQRQRYGKRLYVRQRGREGNHYLDVRCADGHDYRDQHAERRLEYHVGGTRQRSQGKSGFEQHGRGNGTSELTSPPAQPP